MQVVVDQYLRMLPGARPRARGTAGHVRARPRHYHHMVYAACSIAARRCGRPRRARPPPNASGCARYPETWDRLDLRLGRIGERWRHRRRQRLRCPRHGDRPSAVLPARAVPRLAAPEQRLRRRARGPQAHLLLGAVPLDLRARARKRYARPQVRRRARPRGRGARQLRRAAASVLRAHVRDLGQGRASRRLPVASSASTSKNDRQNDQQNDRKPEPAVVPLRLSRRRRARPPHPRERR